MNTTTEKVMQAVQAYKAVIDAHGIEKEKLDNQQSSGLIAPVEFLSKTEANNSRLNQAIIERVQRMNEIVSEYQQDYDEWATVKGSETTEDMALLTSGMTLDPEDYTKLETKHSGNYTMLKAIKSHAERNKVSYVSSAAIEKEPKVKALLELIGVAKNAYTETSGAFSMNDIIFSDDAEFMKWYGSLDRIISLGE